MSETEKRFSFKGLGAAGKDALQKGLEVGKALKEVSEPHLRSAGAAAGETIKKGVDAGLALKRAKEIHKEAVSQKDEAERDFQAHMQKVHEQGVSLKELKEDVMATSIARFVQLWERQKQKANISEKDFELHLHITAEEMEEFKGMGVQAMDIAKGLGTAAIAGAATGTGVTAAVTAFGAASTGTAISSLSGAAANSALLAWLGGGSIAAGGGGMAAGVIVLNSLFIVPAAVVGTVFVAKKGQEALTAATKYAADVEVYVAQLSEKRVGLTAIEQRMKEISKLTTELNYRLRETLALCEADEKSLGSVRTENFFSAASLAKTLCDLMSVPIIDEDLKATYQSGQVVAVAQRVMN